MKKTITDKLIYIKNINENILNIFSSENVNKTFLTKIGFSVVDNKVFADGIELINIIILNLDSNDEKECSLLELEINKTLDLILNKAQQLYNLQHIENTYCNGVELIVTLVDNTLRASSLLYVNEANKQITIESKVSISCFGDMYTDDLGGVKPDREKFRCNLTLADKLDFIDLMCHEIKNPSTLSFKDYLERTGFKINDAGVITIYDIPFYSANYFSIYTSILESGEQISEQFNCLLLKAKEIFNIFASEMKEWVETINNNTEAIDDKICDEVIVQVSRNCYDKSFRFFYLNANKKIIFIANKLSLDNTTINSFFNNNDKLLDGVEVVATRQEDKDTVEAKAYVDARIMGLYNFKQYKHIVKSIYDQFDNEKAKENLKNIGIVKFQSDEQPAGIYGPLSVSLNGEPFTYCQVSTIVSSVKAIAEFVLLNDDFVKSNQELNRIKSVELVIDKEDKIFFNIFYVADGNNTMLSWFKIPLMIKEEEQEDVEYEIVLKIKDKSINAMEVYRMFFNQYPELKKDFELIRPVNSGGKISEVLEQKIQYDALFLSNIATMYSINKNMLHLVPNVESIVDNDAALDLLRANASTRNRLVKTYRKQGDDK